MWTVRGNQSTVPGLRTPGLRTPGLRVAGMGTLGRRAASIAVLALAVLLAGCSDNPAEPPPGGTPLALNISYIPPLFDTPKLGGMPVSLLAERTVGVTIFDVTPNRFVRTDELVEGGDIIVDMLQTITFPDGETAFFDTTFVLPSTESRDYRVRTSVSGAGTFRGTRTIRSLQPTIPATVDIYLTLEGNPPQGSLGVQLADSWATRGTEHLIPVALTNDVAIGGFQFDILYNASTIEAITEVVVDEDSRLYLQATEESLATVGENPVGTGMHRVVVFSPDPAVNPIVAGRAVVLYLSATIASTAQSDTLMLTGVVVSDLQGRTIPVTDVRNASLNIREIP